MLLDGLIDGKVFSDLSFTCAASCDGLPSCGFQVNCDQWC